MKYSEYPHFRGYNVWLLPEQKGFLRMRCSHSRGLEPWDSRVPLYSKSEEVQFSITTSTGLHAAQYLCGFHKGYTVMYYSSVAEGEFNNILNMVLWVT